GHQSLRQERGRLLPLGRRYARSPGPQHLRRQLSPRLAVGRPALSSGSPARQTSPPRHPHPDARLAARAVGLLAYQLAVRRLQTPQRTPPPLPACNLGVDSGNSCLDDNRLIVGTLLHPEARPKDLSEILRYAQDEAMFWIRPQDEAMFWIRP